MTRAAGTPPSRIRSQIHVMHAGTTYRVREVLAEPLSLNANLGQYTNFVNLLDMSAIARPTGFRDNATGFGVSLIGPAWADRALLDLARRYEEIALMPQNPAYRPRRGQIHGKTSRVRRPSGRHAAALAIDLQGCGHREGMRAPTRPATNWSKLVLPISTAPASSIRWSTNAVSAGC